MLERIALLKKAGIVIGEELLGTAARAPLDDVLDAAACAWTGQRIIVTEAESLPPGARVRDVAIWY